MKLSYKLEPKLEQTLELILSPQMLQMLKILNLPYIELVEEIKKEAEENVMLEVERKDALFEYIKFLTSDKKIRKEADFSEIAGLENIKDTSRTLIEHLMDQLKLENMDETYMEIGETLINNIDKRGYLTNYNEVREEIMKDLDVSRPTVDKMLKVIQDFEPDGVGSRDLKECLLIQVREYNFENEELQDILEKAISKHLEDLGKKNYAKIARSLGIKEDGVKHLAEFIKENLNPAPGSYFQEAANHIIPSFAVEKEKGKYKIISLEKHYGPLLKISPEYMRMLEDPKTDKETKEFLMKKLESAKALMENLAKRYETGGKIMAIILEYQETFFEDGINWLKPLLQKEIAGKLGLHPSTISRAISEKHIQTPKGLFPIKFLCPRTYSGFSVPRIKAMIQEIIGKENKKKTLSDDEIKELLKAEGIKITRRTVAFHRKELHIPSSLERKT
ncbi:MAG: RNA polymerase factor sigma-54 [Candidatus Saganbacteria bacterium]|nr:RNA polymerase factor sigma-54 [Candidatus Saganbacteria bacterium]